MQTLQHAARTTRMRVSAAAAALTISVVAALVAPSGALAATADISVLSIQQFVPDSRSSYEIVGEVQNIGSGAIGPVRIDFSFYDANNTLLSTDRTFSRLDRLAPREKSPFKLSFDPVAGYDHYDYAVSDANFDFQRVNHNFTVSVTNRFNDGLFERIVGTVRNNNTTVSEFVSVVGTAYGADGRANDAAQTFVNNSSASLAPGTSATFELVFFSERAFPTYALVAESSTDPSPASQSPSPAPTATSSPSPAPTTTPTTTPTQSASPTPAPTAAPAAAIERLAGTDRLSTAITISKDSWGAGQAQSVVLARSDAFPDALAGTPLAVRRSAPLLLTPPGALNDNVATEIRHVLPAGRSVYLLGGTAALSPAVADAVTRLGYRVVRLAGTDRYATAVTISKQLGTPSTIFLATGLSFQNALIAGVAAASNSGVVVLTADTKMPASTRAYLDSLNGVEHVAVGAQAGAADSSATRVAGASVYDTSRLLAERYFPQPKVTALASGTVFADALAGGAHVGRLGGPLLLSEPTRLPAAVADYLSSNQASIDTATLYGGTAALSASVEDSVRSNLRR